MLKSVFICDLCRTKSAEVEQGHAKAVENTNRSLDYNHMDRVNFPPGWVNIGFSAVCEDCFDLTKSTVNQMATR